MISIRTEAARRIGCSADPRRHLMGEGKIANARRPGVLTIAGTGCPRQTLVSGSDLPEEPDRREASIAQIVRSVIEQGV